MARIREFDPYDVLDKAMKVFWLKGYANTSIDDLVSATGVSRYGLYDEFENKQGLFLAVLDHYQNAVAGMLTGIVERPGASLSEIRALFAKLLEISSSEIGKLGCLMVNSVSELTPDDRHAANEKIEKFRARLQLGFKNALLNAKAAGELPLQFDAEKVADFLIGVMQGVSVMARSHATSKMMGNLVEVALSRLQ